MKSRPSILWFVTAVVVLIVLVFLHGSRHSGTTALSPGTHTTERTTVKVSPLRASDMAPEAGSLASTPQNSEPVPPQDKKEQMKSGLAEVNDVPILFYGKLEDQLGNPVAGAQIAASVRIYNGFRSTVDRFSVSSDVDGLFRINHGKGESLSIVPNKTGYVLATGDTLFKYSFMYADHFTPNPNRPTVIKMWRLQGAEPLVNIDKEYKLPFTGAPIFFDLIAGIVVPAGGDFKITVNRPTGEVSEHNPQKWSIGFEVVDGGFIDTSSKESAITFAAPYGDYQPSGVFGNNNGTDGLDKYFFIQSRNGQVFSKLYLSLGINNKPDGLMYITFRGAANTNGSRNWEATVPK